MNGTDYVEGELASYDGRLVQIAMVVKSTISDAVRLLDPSDGEIRKVVNVSVIAVGKINAGTSIDRRRRVGAKDRRAS